MAAARDARQLALHLLGALVSVLRILGERTEHDHVQVGRDFRPDLRGRLRNLRQVLHRDLERGVARERQPSGEQLVEDDPDRVDVRALVDGGAAGLLRREVLSRPDDRPGLCHLARRRPGDTEVGDLEARLAVAVLREDDVVGLDVAVDDPAAVREAQRAQDLAGDLDRGRDRQRPFADDPVLEAPALEVLHRDVVGALGLAAVVDRDDVRVRQAGGVLGLTPEALDERLVARVAVVQDLDRDAAAQLFVFGEVHVRHPAGAELPQDAVAPVEERVDQGVGDGHFVNRTCSTAGVALPP